MRWSPCASTRTRWATATRSWWPTAPRSSSCRTAPRLLEQARQPAVGERLSAGLARGAVLQGRVAERHLAHGVAADRAGQAGAAADAQAGLLPGLEVTRREPARALDRVAQRRPDRVVEIQHARLVKRRRGLEGGDPGDVEDLVGVGVADPRDH